MTTTIAPVKGLAWIHGTRKNFEGEALRLRVTMVRDGKVYSKPMNATYPDRVKGSLKSFQEKCAGVIFEPQAAKPASTTPKLTRSATVALIKQAMAAGKAAGDAAVPVPMHVVQRANPFDDSSPIVRDYGSHAAGVCGFAWINVKPGNSLLAKILKSDFGARSDSYYGGVTVWVGGYGQSMERKAAYADAYAAVLRAAGFDKVYAASRMD